MTTVKYPDVEVRMTDRDGNVFAIIARVSEALERHVGRDAATEFRRKAMHECDSYDEVLRLCMKTVQVV